MEQHLTQQPLLKRCLALTGAFETGHPAPACFSRVAGDFDGEGLSFGALQWNLGQKTLQPMLQEMLGRHPDLTARIFADGVHALRYLLALPPAAQLEWARGIQDAAHHALNEPWKSRFTTLGKTDEFQAIQMAQAAQIDRDASALRQRFGLTTERAHALMFDIRVQNGGINAYVEAKIRADFDSLLSTHAFADPLATEAAKLRSIANRRAEAAKPNFVEEVRARKLTVATGQGKVHGIAYDLETQFGIRLLPVTDTNSA